MQHKNQNIYIYIYIYIYISIVGSFVNYAITTSRAEHIQKAKGTRRIEPCFCLLSKENRVWVLTVLFQIVGCQRRWTASISHPILNQIMKRKKFMYWQWMIVLLTAKSSSVCSKFHLVKVSFVRVFDSITSD